MFCQIWNHMPKQQTLVYRLYIFLVDVGKNFNNSGINKVDMIDLSVVQYIMNIQVKQLRLCLEVSIIWYFIENNDFK